MWGWIQRVVGIAAGVVDDTVRRWVHDLISGIFGFIHTVFGFVGGAWIEMFKVGANLWKGIGQLAGEVAGTIYHLYRQWIPFIVHWAALEINRVLTYAKNVLHWAAHEFDVVRHWVAALIDATRAWVIRDVWNPIWRTLAPVFRWVTHEGATLWHYLTHPALLVDLLWNHLLVKLEREAWTAGRLLGRFLISLIVHNLRTLVILIEDILTAIL